LEYHPVRERGVNELLTGEVNIVELRRVLRDRIKVPPPSIAAIERLLRDQVIR